MEKTEIKRLEEQLAVALEALRRISRGDVSGQRYEREAQRALEAVEALKKS